MAEIIKFEIVALPLLKLVGKEIRYGMDEHMKVNKLPGFWDQCFKNNIFAPLEAQAGCVYDAAYVGVMTDWERGDGNFSYIVGMLMKTDAVVPDGYAFRELSPTEAALSWIKGDDTTDVYAGAHGLTENALKDAGRGCKKMKWLMELYNCPRFTNPDENGQIVLDYYIPLD